MGQPAATTPTQAGEGLQLKLSGLGSCQNASFLDPINMSPVHRRVTRNLSRLTACWKPRGESAQGCDRTKDTPLLHPKFFFFLMGTKNPPDTRDKSARPTSLIQRTVASSTTAKISRIANGPENSVAPSFFLMVSAYFLGYN